MLVDFIKADSVGDASVRALMEAVQCAIEELDCNETDLMIRTYSKELKLWLSQRKM